MTDGSTARRYRSAGRLYDVVSLERLLYAAPRRRLLQLLDLPVGATVVDVGCGTGLNFPGVLRAIGPSGTLIGVDSSPSMIAAARRRVRSAPNVQLVAGDATDLSAVLELAGIDPARVDAVMATFVVSVIDDDRSFWQAVEDFAARQPLRVGLADIGSADSAAQPARSFYGLLAAFGGADPRRQPWVTLLGREPQTRHEVFRAGHVHVAVATLSR